MISAANINHGLTLAFILLISIVLLIIAGVIGLSSKSDSKGVVIVVLIFIGMVGILYSCTA